MDKDRIKITLEVEKLLKQAISDDYVGTLTRLILEDVIDDVRTSADIDYNEDDLKLAIGRVILTKLGEEV